VKRFGVKTDHIVEGIVRLDVFASVDMKHVNACVEPAKRETSTLIR
jgi:hypothetical protein